MQAHIRFDDRVVIVTGAGGSLGSAYAKAFAARGGKVVVSDVSRVAADKVVQEIESLGGIAIADYHGVTKGNLTVNAAINTWGRLDILVNNAGIIRDRSFKQMTYDEWNAVYEVHLKGAYVITKAAWPIFRQQKYGRIIMTSSAAGLYGSFGQANYCAAKFGLTSFAKTLAVEGAKYNINANSIAPVAASAMTATVKPAEVLAQMSPDFVAPVVLYLCHNSCTESGSIIETGAAWAAKLRWEASKGVIFRDDDTFTPSAVAARWPQIVDYTSGARHPENIAQDHLKSMYQQSSDLESSSQGPVIDYNGQVAIVTGAGGGIGRAYALMYGKMGASVIVNDMARVNADAVVQEIVAAGGQATASYDSVEDGAAIVAVATQAYGTVHIVVNNAGILRDKSFAAMSDKEWDAIFSVHLGGTYSVIKAAWPLMQQQEYGRILNTASLVCNFGQANYSTAKGAIVGFTKALAVEGRKYGIMANILLPTGGTQLTAQVWTPEQMAVWAPRLNAPLVGFLTSRGNTSISGEICHSTGGGVGVYRWQRSDGYSFPAKPVLTPENVRSKWSIITRFDSRAVYPTTAAEAVKKVYANFGSSDAPSTLPPTFDPQDNPSTRAAKSAAPVSSKFTYNQKDCLIYNIGLGASDGELDLVYEGDPGFHVVPSFGVIPLATAYRHVPLTFLPNFNFTRLLHGEQYLEIHGPIPEAATLDNKATVLEVLDKDKAGLVTIATESINMSTGDLLFTGLTTLFIRGAGGFGGRKIGRDFGTATAYNTPPQRSPDIVHKVVTDKRQALIYRLSGDVNPLHIDPTVASFAGFKTPILHGLCTFGIATKFIVQRFGEIKDIKVRFGGHLFPGETIEFSVWKEGRKIIFTARCLDRNSDILSSAAATLA